MFFFFEKKIAFYVSSRSRTRTKDNCTGAFGAVLLTFSRPIKDRPGPSSNWRFGKISWRFEEVKGGDEEVVDAWWSKRGKIVNKLGSNNIVSNGLDWGKKTIEKKEFDKLVQDDNFAATNRPDMIKCSNYEYKKWGWSKKSEAPSEVNAK